MPDKISIAMPTYNGEKYLRAQLDSLYSQTRLPDEVVVTDDRSKDNTVAILEEYHQKYGLKYFINEKNLGVNKNYEKAVTLCTGDYVAISDQDNTYLPEKIAMSYQKLKEIEKNGLPSLVKTNLVEVDAEGNIFRAPKRKDTDSYKDLLFDVYTQGSLMMMNRKLMEHVLPFPPDEYGVFDIHIAVTAAMIGNQYSLAAPLMRYRRHSSNVYARYKKVSAAEKILKRGIHWDRTRFFPLFYKRRIRIFEYIRKREEVNFIAERKELFDDICRIGNEDRLLKKLSALRQVRQLTASEKWVAAINMCLCRVYPLFN